MKILVLNCGSSSVKYQLLDMVTERVMAKGLVERVGSKDASFRHEKGNQKLQFNMDVPDHKVAIAKLLELLTDPQWGVLKSVKEIDGVGHRVVHGGEKFACSVKLSPDVRKTLEECCKYAPLHNPANLLGIQAIDELLPEVTQVGVFDTAFHQTMPRKAYLYAIPYKFYEENGIRRYGFHGTSHRYVSQRVAELMGRDIKTLKIVTCHLGNGASIAAVSGGKSIDTSMGFTPLEGLVMGTRSGDLDPAILVALGSEYGYSFSDIDNLLNKKSGLLGLSGLSNDMRDIEAGMENGHEGATRAFEVFTYRIIKYIGSYAAAMNGIDAIVFTGGIGENSAKVREWVLKGLTYLGLELDEALNRSPEKEKLITKPGSKVQAWVVPTNEELVIARDTLALINEK
ncbi:MAG TPA: acetate kinase [Firmicutes bacterium]|nr:acetate kinase [Bacillota bacterium]